MIRIAYVIDRIESPTAGTEKQLLYLIDGLARSEFEPHLCVLRSSDWLVHNFHRCPVYAVGELGVAEWNAPWNILRFAGFLRQKRIDIVQTHFRDGNIIGVLAARLAGVRDIISTRRNQGYWHTPKELLILKVLNRWVSVFLANSHSTAHHVAATEGIGKERISVIHNGVDVEAFMANDRKGRQEQRAALGLPAEGPLIGTVANLRPVKCVDAFIKSARMVLDRVDDANFVIVGEGQERMKLQALAVSLDIQDRVFLLGKRLNIPETLSALDVGVLTSSSESFSNTLLEYLAAGLPIVCTDFPGATEIMDRNTVGFVVPIGDAHAIAEAVIRIIANGSAPTFHRRNREKAEQHFSLDRMIQRHEELYRSLANAER